MVHNVSVREAAPREHGEGRPQPMTVSQAAMVAHWARWPDSTAFQSAVGLLVAGRLDDTLMRCAIDEVCRDHALTRVRFVPSTPAHVAVVGADSTWSLRWEEAPGLSRRDLEQLPRTRLRQPLDLAEGGLRLYATVGREWTVLTLVGHVAVVDAQSNALLVCELLQRYAALAGVTAGDSPLSTRVRVWGGSTSSRTYAEVAAAEAGFLSSPDAAALVQEQREALAGASIAELALDHARPRRAAMVGSTVRRRLLPCETAALRRVAQDESVTLYAVLLGCFQAFLAERTGMRDLVFGLMATTRSSSSTRRVVGNFANIVPVRARVRPGSGARDLIASAAATVPDAVRRAALPYWVLVEAGAHPRASDGTPVCRIKFNALGAPVGEPLLESVLRGTGQGVDYHGLHVVGLDVPQSEGQLDLSVQISHGRDFLAVDFRYDTELFDEVTVAAHADRYVQILRGLAAGASPPSPQHAGREAGR